MELAHTGRISRISTSSFLRNLMEQIVSVDQFLAKSYILNDLINVFTVKKLKMKDAKAVGKMVIIGVLIVVIVIAGVVGYYLTIPS